MSSSVAFASTPAPLPFRQEEDPVSTSAGAAILLLLVATVAVLWVASRRQTQWTWLARALGRQSTPSPAGKYIAVSASTSMTPNVRLHVVEWDGGQVLVSTNAAGQVTVLQTRPAGGAPEAEGAQR